MGIFSGGRDRTSAGLFIFGGVMQYVELTRDGDRYSLVECIDMPYDTGAANSDLFAAQGIIEDNLRRLRKELGKRWTSKVCAGIQSKDVLLRTVELPKMDIRDIKASFRYEFDRFFPIPVDDAVYDLAFIERAPADDSTQGAASFCLASAVRKNSVENFMLAAQRVGLNLSAIEPSPVAMLRCMTGPEVPLGYDIYALAGLTSSIIVAAYKDNGIVFRNTSQAFATYDESDRMQYGFARDIQATINFAATQLRSFAPDKVYISGFGAGMGSKLRTAVEEGITVPVDIVDPWTLWNIKGTPKETYGYEISLGLALRHLEVR